MTLGQKLSKFRKQQDYAQEQFADIPGITEIVTGIISNISLGPYCAF